MRVAATVCATVFSMPCAAQTEFRALETATMLGTLIASEQHCGLTYDQQSISSWITANVPAEETGFASLLQGMTRFSVPWDGMSASARTAHCASVTQSARHLGLID